MPKTQGIVGLFATFLPLPVLCQPFLQISLIAM